MADKQDRLRESAAAETELQELFHQRLDTLPALAAGNASRSTELVCLCKACRGRDPGCRGQPSALTRVAAFARVPGHSRSCVTGGSLPLAF